MPKSQQKSGLSQSALAASVKQNPNAAKTSAEINFL
jgi:hypothetical protein